MGRGGAGRGHGRIEIGLAAREGDLLPEIHVITECCRRGNVGAVTECGKALQVATAHGIQIAGLVEVLNNGTRGRVHNERGIVGVDKAGGREVASGPEDIDIDQIFVTHVERSHHHVVAVYCQELEWRGLLAAGCDLHLAGIGQAVVLVGAAHRDGGPLGGVQHLGSEVKALVAVDVGHGDAGLGAHVAHRVRAGVAPGVPVA